MAGEMSQCLRAFAALADDMGSGILHGDSQPYVTPLLEDPMPLLTYSGTACMWYIDTHADKRHVYIQFLKMLILKLAYTYSCTFVFWVVRLT